MRRILAFVFPLMLAVLLTGFIPEQASRMPVDPSLKLQRVEIASVSALSAVFNRFEYTWPPNPDTLIPAIEVQALPGDLSGVNNVKNKKSLFFQILLPIVLAENENLSKLRRNVIRLFDKDVTHLRASERRWLETVALRFKVKGNLDDTVVQQRLLRRVDNIPPELALAQAANESAWGTSRFARQGNNLFGHWTYRQSEGIVPLDRPEGASYAVRSFENIAASVHAYMQNINTNPAYQKLRRLRQQMRDKNSRFDSHILATGLTAYSARGQDYVHELQAIMRSNRLPRLLRSVSLEMDL